MNRSDFFIAVYTNKCKEYCDKEFFNAIMPAVNGARIEIVDNTIGIEYTKKLTEMTGKHVHHLDIDRTDQKTLFLRNVTESILFLRDLFLKSKCKYFITVESDVIPPKNFLEYFNDVIDKADIIGGIYYCGFHSEKMFKEDDIFCLTDHVLSGCTLYKREVLEKFPFRYSLENIHAFPDGWMSYDARHAGFILADYSKITCKHLTKTGSDSRGLEDLI